MKIITYLQNTESNCCPREVYKSLLLTIDFQAVSTDTAISKFIYYKEKGSKPQYTGYWVLFNVLYNDTIKPFLTIILALDKCQRIKMLTSIMIDQTRKPTTHLKKSLHTHTHMRAHIHTHLNKKCIMWLL